MKENLYLVGFDQTTNSSASLNPIAWSAAVMGDGNDADHIALQTVDQRIGEAVESKCPRIAHASFAQFGKPAQNSQCLIDLVGEIICCNQRAFADIPIDGGIGIDLRLAAKTDSQQLWRH